jgi:exopolysaccharide production protein ExoZ
MTIIPIQYLRGLAAILVAVSHFKLLPIFDLFSGSIGVDIFFILSGFIMSRGIDKYSNNKLNFIANRIIRIFPLYFILSLPVFLFSFFNGNYMDIISSFFFVGGTFNNYKDSLLFSGWSLFFEFIFYLILILFVSDKKIIAVILISLGLVGFFFTIDNAAGFLFNQFYLLFAIGMFIEKQFDSIYLNTHKTFFFISSILLLLAAMLFTDYSVLFKDENYIPRQYLYFSNSHFLRVLIWGFVSAFFIVAFVGYFKFKKEIIWFRKLGDISYSIYLVHTLLFIVKNSFRILDFRIYNLIMFLLIFPLIFLTYNLIEIKFANWLKKRFIS